MKTKKKNTVLRGSWRMASCKQVLGAALCAAVLLPSCGRADDGVPSVLESRHWGNGCPEGTAFGDITPSLDFEILLTSFGAATDSGKPSAAAKCDFRLRLALPHGKKLRIAETFVQGFANIASLGAGFLRSTYNFAGLPREKWEWRLPANGVLEDFSVQGQPSLFAWPGCSKPVEMVGSLQAQAVRGTDGKDSEIYVQNPVGRQSRMLWDWDVVDCTDADDVTALEGPWQTHYTTAQVHDLTGGERVRIDLLEQFSNANTIILVNPDGNGFAECKGATWATAKCRYEFEGLKTKFAAKLADGSLKAYVDAKYRNDAHRAKREAVAVTFGAEPIGELALGALDTGCPGCSLGNGEWESEYTNRVPRECGNGTLELRRTVGLAALHVRKRRRRFYRELGCRERGDS